MRRKRSLALRSPQTIEEESFFVSNRRWDAGMGGRGEAEMRSVPASPRRRVPASRLLLLHLRELRVVDLDEGFAAQLVDVLGEALVVEVFADPLLQVFRDVGERLVPRGLPLGDVEEMDRAGQEHWRRVLFGDLREH